MVKVILMQYPVMPAADEAARAALRPIGRNSELYQQVLRGGLELVQAADELGLWGVSTIEHHFHSEGYEVGPSPGILNAYWAAITKNVRVGQLGYVMSTQNPIRVAEDTAVLDHLTRGRCFVGFARGYQSRWTNVLGQHLGSRATLSDGSEDDKHNREVFEEQVDMVLQAWTQESIDHNSERWQIPFPYDKGITDWGMARAGATQRLGAHGEVDASGAVRRVSVVPAPYSRPHPPVFVASNRSIETIQYAGRKGFIPTYFSGIGRAAEFGNAYVHAAREHGRQVAYGQSQATVRWPQIGRTRADAMRNLERYDVEIFKNFYSPTTGLPLPPNPVDGMAASGLWVVGDPGQVRDQFVAQWKEFPAEYAVLIYHYAQQPKESVIENVELFMRHVKPALDELTPYNA